MGEIKTWTDTMARTALQMDADGASASQIARATGTTRSAVCGFLHRATLSGRRTPREVPDPIMDRLTDAELLWALARRDAGVARTRFGKRLGLNVAAVIRMFAAIDRDLAASEVAP